MTSQPTRKTEEDPRESTSAPVLVEIPELDDPLVIVSGLPRSGTFLMMSLLAAGGHPILTDQLRTPDPDNPRGYFEYTPVRSLMRDNTCLSAHRGRAIKIISTLLPFIPADLPLKVICMQRHLPEVLASEPLHQDVVLLCFLPLELVLPPRGQAQSGGRGADQGQRGLQGGGHGSVLLFSVPRCLGPSRFLVAASS